MGLVTPHSSATFPTRRASLAHPHRRAMVWIGSIVLGASLLGTIIGHLLSAPPPI